MFFIIRPAFFVGMLALLTISGIGPSNAINRNVDWVRSIQQHAHPHTLQVTPGGPTLKGLANHKIQSDSKKRKKAKRSSFRGLNPRLVKLLHHVESHFGHRVHITSGCRSKKHNRRVGGARKSLHLSCKAADVRVASISITRLKRFLRTLPGHGGIGTYCNKSIVHIDVGPRRSWHYGCKKRRRYVQKTRKRRVASLKRKKTRR